MAWPDLSLHLLNFLAPALALAVLLPLLQRLFGGRGQRKGTLTLQMVLNFVAGLLVLTGSLWWWGRDGKMAAYSALVMGVATLQWVLTRR